MLATAVFLVTTVLANDPQMVAFTNAKAWNKVDLYVVGLDGKGLKKISSLPGENYDPCWSPDGKRIAFLNRVRQSQASEGSPQIYVVNKDGSGLKKLALKSGRAISPLWTDNRTVYTAGKAEKTSINVDIHTGKESKADPYTYDMFHKAKRYGLEFKWSEERTKAFLWDKMTDVRTELAPELRGAYASVAPDETAFCVQSAPSLDRPTKTYIGRPEEPGNLKLIHEGSSPVLHPWSTDSRFLLFSGSEKATLGKAKEVLLVYDRSNGTKKAIHELHEGELILSAAWTRGNRIVVCLSTGSYSIIGIMGRSGESPKTLTPKQLLNAANPVVSP